MHVNEEDSGIPLPCLSLVGALDYLQVRSILMLVPVREERSVT